MREANNRIKEAEDSPLMQFFWKYIIVFIFLGWALKSLTKLL